MSAWERRVLGHPIRVQVQKLDEGYDVSVAGGVKTHVGAVSLAEPDGTERTLERPGHKDSFVSKPWALALAKAWNAPVCVRCGIHYDGVTKAQIAEIMDACRELLEQVVKETTEAIRDPL